MVKPIVKEQNRPSCDWCCGGSHLDVMPGFFRDFDVETDLGGNGIGVCGGCGGLGIIPSAIDKKEFKKRVDEITKLRSSYFPLNKTNFIQLPDTLSLKILKELIEKVTALFKEFGKETDESYAKVIAGGLLQEKIHTHEQTIKHKIKELKSIINDPNVPNDARKVTELEELAWSEKKDIATIETMFRKLSNKFPKSKIVTIGFINFLLAFSRKFIETIPEIDKAIDLETDFKKTASLLLVKAHCLDIGKKDLDSIKTAQDALKIPGIDTLLKKQIENFINHKKRLIKLKEDLKC